MEITSGDSRIFSGESLSLRCIIPDKYKASWDYLWFRGSVQLPQFGETYQLWNANVKESGKYSCQGKKETSLGSIKTLRSLPNEIHVDGKILCSTRNKQVFFFLVFLPLSHISETVKRQILPYPVNFFFSPELEVGSDLKFYPGILTTIKVTIRTIYNCSVITFLEKTLPICKVPLHASLDTSHIRNVICITKWHTVAALNHIFKRIDIYLLNKLRRKQ